MGKIRSRLVTFVVTAKAPNSNTWEQWEIKLQGNRIPEEKREWLAMAHTGGFSEVKLTRVTSASKANKAAIESKADIARAGLALLDEILASRK